MFLYTTSGNVLDTRQHVFTVNFSEYDYFNIIHVMEQADEDLMTMNDNQ